MDLIVVDTKWYRLQHFTIAGAGDTLAAVDKKQCVMGRALDQLFVEIKKLIFLPLQVCSRVRAVIVVGKKCTIFMDHKDGLCFSFDFKLETFASRIVDIRDFAEYVCHVVW